MCLTACPEWALLALAGVGALIAGQLVHEAGWPMTAAVLAGVLLTIPVGILFALPALRTRGVNLAVVTLGLGFTVSQVLFANSSLIGGSADGGTPIGNASLFGLDVDSIRHPGRWAVVCLAGLVLVSLAAANLRRSRTGRRLIAVRTNERAAASLGISVVGAKIYAFGVAAGIAAIGGVLIGFASPTVTYAQFSPLNSINAVADSVIGGIGYILSAPVASPTADGGLGTQLLTSVFNVGDWTTLIGGIILLLVLLTHPHGIADVLVHRLSGLLKRLRLAPSRVETVALVNTPAVPVRPATLAVSDITVTFGGVTAVAGVSFALQPGEVLGLIGPNGAGTLPPTAVTAIKDFDLESVISSNPSELPYGVRRLVAIARTVASAPSIVLLDEPAAGLNDDQTAELSGLIRSLATERKMGILLVEHDVGLVMSTCDRVVVVEFGKVIAVGTPAEISANPRVRTAYLGVSGPDQPSDPLPEIGSRR
jgi:sulfate-transporting ATPase